jgi:hypothetical protein
MQVEQLSQKFTLFAVFVLSAFALAFQNTGYRIIFAIIPFFIFFIGFVINSQSYINTVLSGRMKAVERRIRDLNEGIYILEWESNVAPRFIFTFLTTLRLRVRSKSEVRLPNPVLVAVAFMLLTAQPLITYSSWKAYQLLFIPWNIVYIVIVIVFDILMIAQSFSFFIFGQISDQIDQDGVIMGAKSRVIGNTLPNKSLDRRPRSEFRMVSFSAACAPGDVGR